MTLILPFESLILRLPKAQQKARVQNRTFTKLHCQTAKERLGSEHNFGQITIIA